MSFFRYFCLKSVVIILALSATLLVYYPATKGGFVFDDSSEVNSAAVKRSFAAAIAEKPFRSIPAATYRIDYLIGGASAAIYHVSNIMFHIIAALFLAIFWRRAILWAGRKGDLSPDASVPSLTDDRAVSSEKETAFWVGAMSGASFLLHPANVETVSYISARSDLLAAIFIFLGLWLVIKSIEAAFKWKWYVAGYISLCAGLFCKESAIAGPMIAGAVLILMRFQRKEGIRIGLKTDMLLLLPYLIMIVGWSAFRLSHTMDWGEGPRVACVGKWLLMPWAIGRYARLALWPFGLSLDHNGGPAVYWDAFGPAIFGAAPFLFCAAALYSGWKGSARGKLLIGFAAFWWVIALLPSIVAPLSDPVGERRAYAAMGGLVAAPAIAILCLTKSRVPIKAILSIIILILWGATSGVYALKWQNGKYLWANAVKWYPVNGRAWYGFGCALHEAKQVGSARKALEKSLAIDPSSSKTENLLGLIAMEGGDYRLASEYFEKSLAKFRDDWAAIANLGWSEKQLGNYAKAEEYLRRAIQLNPDQYSLLADLGDVYFDAKRFDDAANTYRRYLELIPNDSRAHARLAQSYKEIGD